MNDATPAEVVEMVSEAVSLTTQEEAAEEFGVTQATVSLWKSGKQSMSLPVRKLAWALIS